MQIYIISLFLNTIHLINSHRSLYIGFGSKFVSLNSFLKNYPPIGGRSGVSFEKRPTSEKE